MEQPLSHFLSLSAGHVRPRDVSFGTYQVPSGPVIKVSIVFLVLTWLTVSLRLWTRGVMVKSLGLDDLTIFITLLFYTVFGVATIVDTSVVQNPDYSRLLPSTVANSMTVLMIAEVFYILTVLAFKISLGLFFLRITHKRWHRVVAYSVMGISTVFSVAYTFFALFQCGTPIGGMTFVIRKFSNQCVGRMSALGMGYTHATIVSTTDFIFAILPISLIRESKMMLREKLIVGFIMVLGTAGSVCSIVRFKYIDRLSVGQLDFFETAVQFALWSVLEPGIGIVANSLATLRPLLRSVTRQAGTLYESRHGTKRNNGSSGGNSRGWHSHAQSVLQFDDQPLTGLAKPGDEMELGTTTTCYPGRASEETITSLPEPPRSLLRGPVDSGGHRTLSIRSSVRVHRNDTEP